MVGRFPGEVDSRAPEKYIYKGLEREGKMDGAVYAYNSPKSSTQQAYTQARLAQLAAQRRDRRSVEYREYNNDQHSDHVERSMSESSTASMSMSLADTLHHRRDVSLDGGDYIRGGAPPPMSPSSGSSQVELDPATLLRNPFELRHGRRYLRDVPYPLPCDLAEIQRQNLRTLLGCQVLGKPVCSPSMETNIPRRVLEIGCGGAYWSAMCHDHFSAMGHTNISFTGLDLARLAPDLNREGMNWRMVQHDIRRLPLPFEGGEFDLVMMKDLSLILPTGSPFQKFFDEILRILSDGGTLEIWESDHVLRALPQHLASTATQQTPEQVVADRTATFLIRPGAPFLPAQNKYIQQANAWITEALDRRKLPHTPCAGIAQFLIQGAELSNIGLRRVAIPLCELKGERDGSKLDAYDRGAPESPVSSTKGKNRSRDKILSADQMAIRQTALTSVRQMIENLEPLLKEVSGKNSEEWTHWWASMTADLSDPSRGTLSGECLELGVWWATKLPDG